MLSACRLPAMLSIGQPRKAHEMNTITENPSQKTFQAATLRAMGLKRIMYSAEDNIPTTVDMSPTVPAKTEGKSTPT